MMSRRDETGGSRNGNRNAHTNPMLDEHLPSTHSFGNWGHGSNIETLSQSPFTNTANMYAALENTNTGSDKRSSIGLRPKNPGLEINYRQLHKDGRNNESKIDEELYRKARDILNKLTPENFDTLLDEIHSLAIDTTERLHGVVDLVFEKAIDESLSVACARFCRELVYMQVSFTDKKKEDCLEFINFKKLLVRKCELEFKKHLVDEIESNQKVKDIAECTDQQKKKDMQLDLEEHDHKLRMKAVGNTRLMGELFKRQMLTVHIMLKCLKTFVETKNEESLECLCILLIIVGRELEINKKVYLADIFDTMKEIANERNVKISSRVRLMIRDVIDLQASKWVPRRQDQNAKSIDQIHNEAKNEYLTQQNCGLLVTADLYPGDKSDSSSCGQNLLSYEEIYNKLLAYFKSGTSVNDIINWITANVGERAKENQFIRTLARACFRDSIVNLKLKTDILQGKYSLLHHFVGNKPVYELQCLHALQALINKLEHPQGLLLTICDKLYEENVFSCDFVAWEASKDLTEQEGKSVTLKQLTSFFTKLKVADEDSSSSKDA